MAKYTGRFGALLIGSTGTTPTYTEVAQIASVGSINIQSDEVEVTTLDNLSGFKEFLQTFKDAGELPVSLIWDPDLATHGSGIDGLWGLFVSGELRPFKISFPTKPDKWEATFNGFVKAFPTPALTPADALTADISIRVSGTVTLTKVVALAADAPSDPTRTTPPLPPTEVLGERRAA